MAEEQFRAGIDPKGRPPGRKPTEALRRYDLYCLCPDTGLILGWQKIEVADERAALRRVRSIAGQAPMELWHDSVLVKHWES